MTLENHNFSHNVSFHKDSNSKKEFLKSCYLSFLVDKDLASKNFEALFNFYRAFYFSNNYDIKIMITRRSYVIFKIFENVFIDMLKDNEKSSINQISFGTFYSSNFISQIPNIKTISKEKFLIIDDIVINGRTMETAYNKLSSLKNVDKNNIKLHAFLINEEAKCLNKIKDFFIDYDDEIEVSESYWRAFSDELNLFIAVTNIGYTSYVDTIKIQLSSNKDNILNKSHKQTNFLFEKIGLESHLLALREEHFCETPKLYNLLTRLKIFACLRLYFNKTGVSIDEATAIPFAYLPSIKTSDFVSYSLTILHYLIECTNINKDILTNIIHIIEKDKTEDDFIFLYEWLSFVLSKLISIALIKSNTIVLSSYDYKICISCKETFNTNYVPDITIVEDENYNIDYLYQLLDKDTIVNSAEYECVSKYKELKGKIDIIKILPSYLSEIRKVDEKRACCNEKRLKGLRAEDIYFINDSKMPIEDIMILMINSWDCGDGSGSPKIFNYKGDNIISTSIINGEQIYRYVFDSFPQETYDFWILYSNLMYVEYRLLEDFAEYMNNSLNTTTYTDFLLPFKDNMNDFIFGIKSRNITNKTSVELKKNSDLILRYLGVWL